jgi:diguanylate cyclase (GGDEF)-like protein
MKLERHSDVLFSTLAEITSLIVGGTDKQKIFHRLIDGCLIALEAERVYLLELDGVNIIKYSKSKTAPDDLSVQKLEQTPVLRKWMFRETHETSGAVRQGEELAFDLSFFVREYFDECESDRLIISSPLVATRTMFGLLVAIHRADGGCYSPEDVRLITALANHAAIALENQLLYRKLEHEAITDGLTGVHNYRFMMSSLDREIKRAKRFKQSFSFIMLDVDNLKEYNDRLGHLSGSEALRQIANIIKNGCRDIDLVCKYGGDEFAVILPQTLLDGAQVVAQRVIEGVYDHTFDGEHPRVLSCSCGIACYPQDGQTGREIVSSADRALYEAKRSGKNKLATTADLHTSESR